MLQLSFPKLMKGTYSMYNNFSTNNKKNKYLNLKDKVYIEAYLQGRGLKILYYVNKGITKDNKKLLTDCIKQLALKLNKSEKTIRREINRGSVTIKDYLLNEIVCYCHSKSVADRNKKIMNRKYFTKIDNNISLIKYLAFLLNRKYSPYAALIKAKEKGYDVNISLRTLYHYINSGKLNKYGYKYNGIYRKRKTKQLRYKRIIKVGGESIENRDNSISKRLEFGHWEIDTVVGIKNGKSTCILTLTERLTRANLMFKLEYKRNEWVNNTLIKLINSKKHIIKSITSDNGSEFFNPSKIIEKGIKWYYAHPYSSNERGSNENNNRFVRRFIPKGKSMKNITHKDVKTIEDFMNNYPRRIFNGKTSMDMYLYYLKKEKEAK